MKTKIMLTALCILMVLGLTAQAELVAYWPLNEGSGQIAADASANGNDGTLGDTTNPETADPVWVTDAERGTVLEWSGDNAPDQWVNLTTHLGSFSGLNQGTITAWIKIGGGNSVDVILAASDSGDSSSELRFFYEGSLRYDIRDDSSNPLGEGGNLSSSVEVADNAWHFVAITVDSNSNAALYVDGQLVEFGSEPFFAGVADIDHMSLGRNIDSGGTQWVFKGRMSDVAVFDKPLDAGAVEAIYNGRSVLDVDKYASAISPALNAAHVDTAVSLQWQSAATNPEYTVYFGTDPAFPSGPAATELTSPNYSPGALTPATTYYWRVDVDEDGTTYPGSLWSFETGGKATDPAPVHDAVSVFTSPTLSWTGDALIASYDVYLAESAQPLTFRGNTTESEYQPGELEVSATYNWRIDTRAADGTLISTGDVWTFTTLSAGAFFKEVDIFVNGTEGYACYRIPSIIVAPNGDILAFCEGRKNNCGDHGDVDIVMKRSIDNGHTWQPLELIYEEGDSALITIGNPCPVVDESNGRLWMPFCRNNSTVYVGIQLKNAPYTGRLVIPSDHGYGGYGSHMMYSDDHGVTWNYSERILPGCNECQAVELIDGTVMNNARSYEIDPDHRAIATSTDGGHTWSEAWFDQELPEPTCQASFLRFTRSDSEDINRVIFSNPAHTSSRVNMTVKMSYDEGESWPVAKQIYAGSGAYSCLVVTPDWNIGCFYEKDGYTKITLALFSLEWLTDGADTLDFCSTPIEGDVNKDCIVNLEDFAAMAANWLQCNLVPQRACLEFTSSH